MLADGFYEWQAVGRKKQSWWFRVSQGEPFALAGLWERWQGNDGQLLESCTLITTEANEVVRPVHDRMPVILARPSYERWLDPKVKTVEELAGLLVPHTGPMTAAPVGLRVNNPRADDSECIRVEAGSLV